MQYYCGIRIIHNKDNVPRPFSIHRIRITDGTGSERKGIRKDFTVDDTARYILAIAEKGSISQAAESIHMSQSALSQRLANEERLLGIKIFNRAHIPIQVTDAGKAYLEWARSSIRAEENLREKLARVTEGEKRILRVGISAPRYTALVCDVAERFIRENPACELEFTDVGKRELINAAFVNGLIDFSVLTPQQPEPSLFISEPICQERYVYVAPKAWGVPTVSEGSGSESGLPEVNLDTIANHPFIMPTFANRISNIIDSLFGLAAAKPPIIATCASPAMQLALVERGLGASIFTTASDVGEGHPDVQCYDVQGIAGASYLYYSYRKGRCASADEIAFMALVREFLDMRGLLLH